MYKEYLKGTTQIGKGAFTTAYRKGNKVYVVSTDQAKEAIALFCKGSHIPKVERLEYGEKSLYVMPLYRKVTKAQHPKAWADYRSIHNFLTSLGSGYGFYITRADNMELFFTKLSECKAIRKPLRDQIAELIETMFNYTDAVGIEISPRNIAVDGRGRLVLLDIVYNPHKL